MLQTRARGGGGVRRDELRVGQLAQNKLRRAKVNRRHLVDFVHLAARQQHEHGRIRRQFQAFARGGFVGLHRQRLRQRMPYKQRLAARRFIQRRFHRKQTQHLVHLLHNLVHPLAFPCPHRWRNIMHGGNTRRFKLRRHAQIEIGRVNAHKHRRANLL